MSSSTLTSLHDLTIDIGEIPILVRTDSPDFAHMLEDRYGEFVSADAPHAVMELEIELLEETGFGTRDTGHGKDGGSEPRVWTSGLGLRTPNPGLRNSDSGFQTPSADEYDQDLSVRLEAGRWVMERGDFRAEWDPQCNRGWVRQSANPYAIDGVLRILHSLILAREGGFLVHAASAVRNGRAFVFAGVSGAGKTTLARLAPPDVTLLTDEISYVRDTGYGTRDTGTGSVPNHESGVRSRKSEGRSPRSRPSPESKSQITNFKSQITNRQSPIGNQQSKIENLASPESPIPSPVSRVPAFQAFGTPFAGELARIGQKVRAPLAALFLLKQGPENRIEPLSEAASRAGAAAARAFLRAGRGIGGDDFPDRLRFCEARPGPPAGVHSGCARLGVDRIDDCRLRI